MDRAGAPGRRLPAGNQGHLRSNSGRSLRNGGLLVLLARRQGLLRRRAAGQPGVRARAPRLLAPRLRLREPRSHGRRPHGSRRGDRRVGVRAERRQGLPREDAVPRGDGCVRGVVSVGRPPPRADGRHERRADRARRAPEGAEAARNRPAAGGARPDGAYHRARPGRRRPRPRPRQRRALHVVGAMAQHAAAQHRVAAGLRVRERGARRTRDGVSRAERHRHERPRARCGELRLDIAELQDGRIAEREVQKPFGPSLPAILQYCNPAMSIVVQKYGGSSVADVAKLKQVADRVVRTRRSGHDVVVVVSAMGDTTDELLGLAKQVSPNPDRRELDMLLTAGERVSMALLSMAIRELGGDAISFTGSQSGIITNDRHTDARIVEVRPFRVQDELARGRIVVVAGYQGVSYRREVTTLGRGGSDTTAVALAAALGADYCEICSDVDGVYSADPRVVAAARRIGTLSYEETQELAESGAKVLNAQAVEFAKEKGIAIYARATTSPLPGADPSADGTVVRRHPPRMPGTVVGVASERDLLVLKGGGTEILALLDDYHVAGKQLHVSGDRLTLVISRENLHEEARLRDALAARFGQGVHISDTLGAISVVGAGINASFDNVRRGSEALTAHGMSIDGIATSS